MLPVRIEIASIRRWWNVPFRRRRFDVSLPQQWAEVPVRKRLNWWVWLLDGNRHRIVLDALHLPRRVTARMAADDMAALKMAMAWMAPEPNCTDPVLDAFDHHGRTYYLPKPKGHNLTCIEYPIADSYYERFVGDGSAEALLRLVATLCREKEPDEPTALARGDVRVPLLSRSEAEARAERLKDLPAPIGMAVLMYFAGLKQYIHKTYGAWLFEEQEEEEEDDTDADTPKPRKTPQRGPDFGWWGIYQQVAESGVFGPLKDVYQASYHEVCVYLVRKKQEEQSISRAQSAPASQD